MIGIDKIVMRSLYALYGFLPFISSRPTKRVDR